MGTKTQSSQSVTYSKCKSYFLQNIREIDLDIEKMRGELQALNDVYKAACRKIGKQESRLYGGNLLNFIAFEGCFLFPFAILTVLLCFLDVSAVVRLIPVMVWLALSLIIAIVKLVKRAKFAKERKALYNDCLSTEAQILSCGKNFKASRAKRKKMARCFKKLKNHPNMDEEKIYKLKKQFDKI